MVTVDPSYIPPSRGRGIELRGEPLRKNRILWKPSDRLGVNEDSFSPGRFLKQHFEPFQRAFPSGVFTEHHCDNDVFFHADFENDLFVLNSETASPHLWAGNPVALQS
jgi:hypothetical protein